MTAKPYLLTEIYPDGTKKVLDFETEEDRADYHVYVCPGRGVLRVFEMAGE